MSGLPGPQGPSGHPGGPGFKGSKGEPAEGGEGYKGQKVMSLYSTVHGLYFNLSRSTSSDYPVSCPLFNICTCICCVNPQRLILVKFVE